MTTLRGARLTPDELAVWHAFKRAGESVRAVVAEEITRATGLSDPDFGIVTRLADAGGAMRQNELAVSMGWHRSRLSHQLTRMADRGLIARGAATTSTGVQVAITDAGRAAARDARPVHAAAVRRHLLDRIPADDRTRFATLLEELTQT